MKKILLLLLLIIFSVNAPAKEKFLSLKEIMNREDFLQDKEMVKYFCSRCSALYFASVAILKNNSSLDGGDKGKSQERIEKKKIYNDWAFNFLSYCTKEYTAQQIALTLSEIKKMVEEYCKKSDESKLYSGNIEIKDDLEACKSFINFVVDFSKKKSK